MREFDLGDVLSVSDGRLLSERGMDGVYDIIGFLLSDPSITTIGLMVVAQKCKEAVLKQHPQLAEFDGSKITPENWKETLQKAKKFFGDKLPIHSLEELLDPVEPRTFEDDIKAVLEINPNAKIIGLSH